MTDGMAAAAEPERWSAGAWQRRHAPAFARWRESADSAALPGLRTLCDAVNDTVRQLATGPERLGALLEPTRSRCDELAFDDPDEVAAYTLQHLADRYGRVTRVLEEVFAAGHLPLRRRGLTVLEVGAGPAPALHAVRDLYADLARWAAEADPAVTIAPAAVTHALDRGAAWPRLLHLLSENVIARREVSPTSGVLPFGVRHGTFEGFSTYGAHLRELEREAARIVDEHDADDGWISDGAARRAAEEAGVGQPSAYDLVVVCNFLTTDGVVTRFERELRHLATALTPGGLFVAVGAARGAKYARIRDALERVLAGSALTRLPLFEAPLRANERPAWAREINAQRRAALTALDAAGALPLREPIPGPDDPFPEFRVVVWKNQRPARKGRARAPGPRRPGR
ncbi:hypothetical protein [Streptomyces sp. NPDC054784]